MSVDRVQNDTRQLYKSMRSVSEESGCWTNEVLLAVFDGSMDLVSKNAEENHKDECGIRFVGMNDGTL